VRPEVTSQKYIIGKRKLRDVDWGSAT